ncbi:pantoate--beta-alanine ligase [Sphingomonas sp. URHD0057]|uniref:pantoate--beta-alanine ligase n=1 Tax=Sphingomonas sp. URHD0057 TaxID=1380389 RepID=UPI003FA681A4
MESGALDFALSCFVADGDRIAFVPTMGALHDGHLALVAQGKELADRVVVSIFVNPLQFNDASDLERYPREKESDLAKLEAAGCDLVWLPSASDLYPEGFATSVRVAGVSERWEGEHRPGHFEGVATVVAKLFNEVVPNVALFGEKDFQQLAVIRRMAIDLGLCDNIVGVPTVRETDGLALSSRNAYLSLDERQQALALPRALEAARAAILSGNAIDDALGEGRNSLLEGGFSRVDYFAAVDAETLEPLDRLRAGMRLIAAAVIGSTRLIDNVAV